MAALVLMAALVALATLAKTSPAIPADIPAVAAAAARTMTSVVDIGLAAVVAAADIPKAFGVRAHSRQGHPIQSLSAAVVQVVFHPSAGLVGPEPMDEF